MATLAGAVVSAAVGALIKRVVAQAVKLGKKKCDLWKELPNDIYNIEKELVLIAGAEEMNRSGNGNPSAVMSISMEEMRDLALDIEDCLDRIMRYAVLKEASPFHDFQEFCKNFGSPPSASEVKQLLERIDAAKKRQNHHNVNDGQRITAVQPAATPSLKFPKVAVGMDKPKRELLQQLNTEGQLEQLNVISIVGFSGLGKSRLAREVYDHDEVARQFRPRAWVVASNYRDDTKGLLTALFKMLAPNEQAEEDVEDLRDQISERLNAMRYLIVLDDVKETDWWFSVQPAFPQNTSSKIIVTTAIQTVANFCSGDNGYVHNMRTLDDKHSMELFKNVLAVKSPQLEQSSTSVVDKCDGHPLALVTMARYLSSKVNRKRVDADLTRNLADLTRNLGYHIAKTDDFKKLREDLMNNYRGLPGEFLKTCLMYLCVFPNGCHIAWSRLMRRLLAERYLQHEHPRTDVDAAHEYLEILIERNVIIPIDSRKNREVKTCRAHRVMHEFMLEISRSVKFITSIEDPEKRNYRHIYFQNTSSGMGRSGDEQEKLRAHSLTICGSAEEAVDYFGKCELLRVLDLEECDDLKNEHIVGIPKMWHLRYLSLGGNISRLPKKIEKLYCLETLDMRKTKREIALPVEVIKLPYLVHLMGKFKLQVKKTFFGERKLEVKKSKECAEDSYFLGQINLQTLAGFVTEDNPVFPMLMVHMNSLRKVKIWCNTTGEEPQLSKAIQNFMQRDLDTGAPYRSLSLHVGNSAEKLLTSLDNSRKHYRDHNPRNSETILSGYLSSLKLHGALNGLTQFVTSLGGLSVLCISSTNSLESNELSNLRKLKILKYLKLVKVGLREFIITTGDFPLLEHLFLVQCPSLPTIKQNALQMLHSLELLDKDLDGLSGIEIEQHKCLQEITLDSGVKEKTIKVWEDAAKKHPERPRVLFKKVDPDGAGPKVKYVATERPETKRKGSIQLLNGGIQPTEINASVASTEMPTAHDGGMSPS